MSDRKALSKRRCQTITAYLADFAPAPTFAGLREMKEWLDNAEAQQFEQLYEQIMNKVINKATNNCMNHCRSSQLLQFISVTFPHLPKNGSSYRPPQSSLAAGTCSA